MSGGVVVREARSLVTLYSAVTATSNMCDLARALANTERECRPGYARPQLQLQWLGLEVSRSAGGQSETVRHIEDQMMRTDSVSPLSCQSDCCMYQLLTTKGFRFLLVLTTALPPPVWVSHHQT